MKKNLDEKRMEIAQWRERKKFWVNEKKILDKNGWLK
jgi:hypothetical protein